ncbi:dienelactone hydrolase family protein [Mycobacterium xenopi 4042]|uniref:Dienelactone hydrolase family protein n=1 Tax=Mycobacterium xenopi 4042 TaxID=1299334 RepID=X8BJG2_MYCXE|nr:dienelactone hydrolase family protein [Mycobacterium xenopi 4042]
MAQREDVQFTSGHERVSAWLYRPEAPGDAPMLVMAHGLGGVRTMRLDAYAERFSAAGYACLVFDYRNFGDSEGEPRQLLDIGMQLQDWAAAVAYARTLPDIDSRRIGLWGTSFSSGHVIATAAQLPGIAAVVAQCPFTDGIASARVVNPLTIARVTALAVRDLAGARLGRPPVMVPVVGHPGEVAMMTAPDAYPGFMRLVPDGVQVRNEVAARFGVKVLAYRPGAPPGRSPARSCSACANPTPSHPPVPPCATPPRHLGARSRSTPTATSTSTSGKPSTASLRTNWPSSTRI